VAERAVGGRHHVLDLVRQEARRVYHRGGRRPEQQHDRPAVADGLVDQQSHASDGGAFGDEQHMPRPRVHLEHPAHRSHEVQPVAGPLSGDPGRRRAA